jgi:hypothetical protein
MKEKYSRRKFWEKRDEINMRKVSATCGALFSNATKMHFVFEMHNPM